MTTWIVTRHPGALEFLERQGITGTFLPHLDVGMLKAGDKVIGTLPVQLIHAVNCAGVEYWHLCLEQGFNDRGREHTADYMQALGVSLRRFRVVES